MMERRFEAYKTKVIMPFFRDHFARLDRQIVLIDALQAINRGPEAVLDLENALADVLSCFRLGSGSLLSSLFTRQIDKVLIAATKADHLHHESHVRLQMMTRRIVMRSLESIGMSGAGVDVMALASVRATKEATRKHDGQTLPVIVGTPMQGERIGKDVFDGVRQTAIFPGDLPEQPDGYFKARDHAPAMRPEKNIQIVRFRPPMLDVTDEGLTLSIPHIRLDRALQFLLGDRLQ
jgi:predicted YcjX-like family ATPase